VSLLNLRGNSSFEMVEVGEAAISTSGRAVAAGPVAADAWLRRTRFLVLDGHEDRSLIDVWLDWFGSPDGYLIRQLIPSTTALLVSTGYRDVFRATQAGGPLSGRLPAARFTCAVALAPG